MQVFLFLVCVWWHCLTQYWMSHFSFGVGACSCNLKCRDAKREREREIHELHVECVGCELTIGSLTSRLPSWREDTTSTLLSPSLFSMPDQMPEQEGAWCIQPGPEEPDWSAWRERLEAKGEILPEVRHHLLTVSLSLSLTSHYVTWRRHGRSLRVKVNPTSTAWNFLFEFR